MLDPDANEFPRTTTKGEAADAEGWAAKTAADATVAPTAAKRPDFLINRGYEGAEPAIPGTL